MHVLPHGSETARRGLLRLLLLRHRAMSADTGWQVLLRIADIRLIAEMRRFGLKAAVRGGGYQGQLWAAREDGPNF